MRKTGSVLRYIDTISEWMGKLASFLILFIVVVILYEVVMRYVFNNPTIWVHETSLFLFGAIMLLGGAYTLLLRGHVNMDVVYIRLSARGRAITDLVTFIFFLVSMGVLAWKGGDMAWKSISFMEKSQTIWGPVLWPGRIMIPIGAFLLVLQGLAKFVRDINTARGGESIER